MEKSKDIYKNRSRISLNLNSSENADWNYGLDEADAWYSYNINLNYKEYCRRHQERCQLLPRKQWPAKLSEKVFNQFAKQYQDLLLQAKKIFSYEIRDHLDRLLQKLLL